MFKFGEYDCNDGIRLEFMLRLFENVRNFLEAC